MEEVKIFLQPDDEITDVIDKIKKVEKSIIVLVIPESAMVLQSIVNLKLLKKEADDLDRRLAIVTDSKKGRQLAGQVGISVYKKAKADEIEKEEESKKVVDDIRSRFPLSDSKSSEEKQEATEEKSKNKEKKRTKKGLSLAKVFLIALLVVLVGGGSAWAYMSLDRANIKLKVDQESIEEQVLVTASLDSGHQMGSFKAELVEETATAQAKFDATGRKEVGGSASGDITVYNYWSSDPQPLVETTRFVHSSTGKLFRTTETVSVPGTRVVEGETVPGTITVNIKADEIGSSYNVGPGQFRIPGLPSAKQEKIYGRTDSGMSGGYEKEILVVSQQDYNQAKEELSAQLDEEINEKISNRLIEGQVILEGKEETILEESASPDIGQEAGSFKLTLKKRVKTLTYSQEDYLLAIKEKVDSNLSGQSELLADNLADDVEIKNINLDLKERQAKIKTMVNGVVVAKIDRDIIKENLFGKNEMEGERYLTGFSQIKDAQIELSPFWVNRVPESKEKITIEIVHGE